ncbi:MAG: UDP-N-acetylmuramate dehydrogenase [Candidatus Levybacteria bacterium]|nr:UDP-N-acetylmuramate dehydrogenase [Candidatus Levybacteria bacterium]
MDVYRDFPLSKILYYKIGGKASFVLKVQNKEDLLDALGFIQKNKVKKILPIGLGSNLLVSDEPFKGAVLWFSREELKGKNSTLKLHSGNIIETFASVLLDDLIQFSFAHNLIGLEWAGGLPSTVGGAIRGNAGAFGSEIKDSVYEVEVLDLSNENYLIKTFSNDDLQFSYRNSLLKKNKNLIAVSGFFKLKKANKEDVEMAKQVYFSYIEHRKKYNPLEYPSCGSVFQNITEKEKTEAILAKWPDVEDLVSKKWHGKVAMGYIINRLGFSGMRIGGAEVSQKHANYILNKNKARFNDVLSIIDKIKAKFSQTFGFPPELELEIVK